MGTEDSQRERERGQMKKLLHGLSSDPIFNSVIDLFIKIHPKPNYSINNTKPNEKIFSW